MGWGARGGMKFVSSVSLAPHLRTPCRYDSSDRCLPCDPDNRGFVRRAVHRSVQSVVRRPLRRDGFVRAVCDPSAAPRRGAMARGGRRRGLRRRSCRAGETHRSAASTPEEKAIRRASIDDRSTSGSIARVISQPNCQRSRWRKSSIPIIHENCQMANSRELILEIRPPVTAGGVRLRSRTGSGDWRSPGRHPARDMSPLSTGSRRLDPRARDARGRARGGGRSPRDRRGVRPDPTDPSARTAVVRCRPGDRRRPVPGREISLHPGFGPSDPRWARSHGRISSTAISPSCWSSIATGMASPGR